MSLRRAAPGGPPRSRRPPGAGSCPRCRRSARAQALREGLSAPGRTSRRGCAREAPARGSAVAGGRGRGWLPPGQRGDAASPILPIAVRADLASAPKLVGSPPRVIAWDYPAPGLEGEDAEQAMLPGTVRGRGWAPPAVPALLSARVSPYFRISSSRAGQPLLTDSRGDLSRPLLAGCISARHTVGGRAGKGRSDWAGRRVSGSGRVWSFSRPGATRVRHGQFCNGLSANSPLRPGCESPL